MSTQTASSSGRLKNLTAVLNSKTKKTTYEGENVNRYYYW